MSAENSPGYINRIRPHVLSPLEKDIIRTKLGKGAAVLSAIERSTRGPLPQPAPKPISSSRRPV